MRTSSSRTPVEKRSLFQRCNYFVMSQFAQSPENPAPGKSTQRSCLANSSQTLLDFQHVSLFLTIHKLNAFQINDIDWDIMWDCEAILHSVLKSGPIRFFAHIWKNWTGTTKSFWSWSSLAFGFVEGPIVEPSSRAMTLLPEAQHFFF